MAENKIKKGRLVGGKYDYVKYIHTHIHTHKHHLCSIQTPVGLQTPTQPNQPTPFPPKNEVALRVFFFSPHNTTIIILL